MDYNTSENFLSRLQFFGIKLGLDQVLELLSHLGNPHEKLKFIHIAGSNGKGSTGAMLVAALRSAGLKTGFYSSPHLISARERFRIDGKAMSKDAFCDMIEKIQPSIEKMEAAGRCPTYFEVTTAIAAMYFAEQNTDFVIWETGMGGRYDATNVVDPVCSVITGISLEHQAYLGDTIEEIAFEKAGIIKPGKPVFCGRMNDACKKVVLEKCCETKSEPIFAEAPLRDEELSLNGEIQKYNAGLAFAILKRLAPEFHFSLEDAVKGLSSAKWPGRMQILPDGSIVDGAHNPDGAKVLSGFLDDAFPGEKFTFIFASFEDKDSADVLKELKDKAELFIFVPIQTSRKSVPPSASGRMLAEVSDIAYSTAGSLHEALKLSVKKRRLITGSLYLAGEALKELLPEKQILDI